MALKKTVTTNFGIDANYWRVDRLLYLKQDKVIVAHLGLYTDKEISLLAKNSLDSVEVCFSTEGLNMSSDWRILAYDAAKGTVLEGAEDC